MQEILRTQRTETASEKKKKQFDLNALDKKKKRKMKEFNSQFDNTMLQMGDESEQIVMDNLTLYQIINDPEVKKRKDMHWTNTYTLDEDHRYLSLPFANVNKIKQSVQFID